MKRLIDASNIRGFAKYADYTEKEGEFTPYITLDNLVKLINEQPTVYDVNKVVEKLEQQAEQYHNRAERYAVLGVTREVEHMAGKAASYEHAIEIVKAGGVG